VFIKKRDKKDKDFIICMVLLRNPKLLWDSLTLVSKDNKISNALLKVKNVARMEPVFETLQVSRTRFRQAGNRFLGSLTGLQIRALVCFTMYW
jgi:hypothetical protein